MKSENLFDVILTTLQSLDGLCLDNHPERFRVASDVTAAILDYELDVLSGIDNPVSER